MTDDLAADEPAEPSELILFDVRNGIETPKDVRDQVFRLWAWTHKERYSKVAEVTRISEATLRSWAKKDDWRYRALQERMDMAPEHVRGATGTNLQFAALDSSIYLLRVAAGEEEANRARLMAAFGTLDRAGWAPAHYVSGSEPKPKRQPVVTRGMTPEELHAIELQLAEEAGEE